MVERSRHDKEDAARREALGTLDRLRREDDTFATSALARTARRAADHFGGKDAVERNGTADPIEFWGRRIGRGLSLVAFIGLAIYLYVTYVAK